jgi:hypothetical protein
MESAIKQIILNSPVPENPNNVEILVHTAWTDDHDPIRVVIEVKDDDDRIEFFHSISKIVFDKFYETRYENGAVIAEPTDD